MKGKKIIGVCIIITFSMLIMSLFWPNFNIDRSTCDVFSDCSPNVLVYNAFGKMDKEYLVKDNIDSSKLGEYELEYGVKFLFIRIKKKFRISVIDKEEPSTLLEGDNPVLVCPGKDYVEKGYKTLDNYDGDITDKVLIEKRDNSIWYIVKDSSGNENKVERKLIFEDREGPVLELKGSSTIYIYLGNSYYEPGYTASDNCDGDITDKVIVNSNVDTSKVGTYNIKYEVSDNAGNITSVERTVIVRKRLSYYGDGNIYLTFDDGPSYLTKEILDILDEENVKVTFFVTSPNEYTKRAYDSGHTIGLHSYTHDYGYIYASSKNYFNDLNNISDRVYNVIGVRSKIMRFPGGSSNTVSRNYNRGIMTYLTNEVVNRGYTYFDWNVDSNDAGSDIYNSTNIYYNVINHLSHDKTNVVLMHDSGSHSATVRTLRDIIRYGKENGYTFKAITESTPVITHGVNN